MVNDYGKPTDHVICAGCKRPYSQEEWRRHRATESLGHWPDVDAEGCRVLCFMGPVVLTTARPER